MSLRSRLPLLFLLAALSSGGLCPLGEDAAYGRPCDDDSDCPGEYSCGPSGTCAKASGPSLDAGGGDGGEERIDGGSPRGEGGPASCDGPFGPVNPGDPHPEEPCLVCDDDGSFVSGCPAGEACSPSGCARGCLVGGVFYAEGGRADPGACVGCVPGASTSELGPLPAGTGCGGELLCDGAGECAMPCTIGGVRYPNGAADPVESCRYCDSSVSLDGWLVLPDGAPCADDGNVCTTGECQGGGCVSRLLAPGTPCGEGTCDGAGICSAPQPLRVMRAGNGAGDVSSDPVGIACGDACAAEFDFGTTVVLSARPDPATSVFAGFEGACAGGTPCAVHLTSPRFVTAIFQLAKRQLTARTLGTGAGTITSSPSGISCGGACIAELDHGTVVDLTAEPDAATSVFIGWSGACSGAGPCAVTMTEAKEVEAEFGLAPRRLIVERGGSGQGTVRSDDAAIVCGSACSAEYPHGSAVRLTATPESNSVFLRWSGDCGGDGSTCLLTLDAAKTAHATFLLLHPLAVDLRGSGAGVVTSSAGGISCPGTCGASLPEGTALTLSAAADLASSRFEGWSGDCAGTDPCALEMSAARNVSATFSLLPRDLVVQKDGDGTGVVVSDDGAIACGAACHGAFPHGTTVRLSASAKPGSQFAGWEGDCVVQGPSCNVTLNGSKTVRARFVRVYHLQIEISGEGTVTTNDGTLCDWFASPCFVAYASGEEAILEALPYMSGQMIWFGCDSALGTQCVVQMTTDRYVSVTFCGGPEPC